MWFPNANGRDISFFGNIHNGLGDLITFYFNYFSAQLCGQFEIIDKVPLLIQFDLIQAFAAALHIQNDPGRSIIGCQPGGFADHDL